MHVIMQKPHGLFDLPFYTGFVPATIPCESPWNWLQIVPMVRENTVHEHVETALETGPYCSVNYISCVTMPIPFIGVDKSPSSESPQMATSTKVGRLMTPPEVLLAELVKLFVSGIMTQLHDSGTGEIWTRDLPIKSRQLYLLSYGSI